MTVQATGYQWYWGYQLPDQQIEEFASYIVADEDLKEGQPRLLTTDNALVLPVDTDIQILVTAGDVIHSWAVPSFGIKTDAVPGRMNETWVRIDAEGTYYGPCSQICGPGQGLRPTQGTAVRREVCDHWVVKR